MLSYQTELSRRTPLQNTEQYKQEMSAFAPQANTDAFNTALNLAAYQRNADDANLGYDMDHRQKQNQLVLSGLANMNEQEQAYRQPYRSFLSSLLTSIQ